MPLANELMATSSADVMHRRHQVENQGLSVLVFKNIVFAVKKNNWRKIESEIARLDAHFSEYKKVFGIDLKEKLNKAMDIKRVKTILKLLAQEVFLSMKFQFKIINDSQMSDSLDSKARLMDAKEGYIEILSGNIKRKNPKANTRVEAAFLDAEIALGNPGINPLIPQSPADLEGFKTATEVIEGEIKKVYTYF